MPHLLDTRLLHYRIATAGALSAVAREADSVGADTAPMTNLPSEPYRVGSTEYRLDVHTGRPILHN